MRRLAPVLVVLLVVSLLGTGGAGAEQGSDIERRSGQGRIETAVDVARTHWQQGADTVLLATAGNFPDALAAAPLAASLDAPLLLTPGNSLPSTVADTIDELEPDTVIVLGGTGAISDAVVTAVEQLASAPEVERITGSGRFETAAAIARRAGAPQGIAVLASGGGFPDALAAGATAGTPARPPVLLTTRDSIPEPTRAALRDLGISRVMVIGGGAAIGGAVEEQLREMEIDAMRLRGSDRFGTAAAVLRALPLFGEVPDRSRVVVATGTDFPDALTAGPLAARLGVGLALAAPSQVPAVVRDELALRQTRSAVLVGGRAALGQGAEDGVRASFAAPQPVTQADGPTLTVDGDAVTVTDETWRTFSVFDEGNPPTFTLLGAASGEVVDVVLTEIDITNLDTGERIGAGTNARGRTGMSQEVNNRRRPLELHGDDEAARRINSASVRLSGCPCTVQVSATTGFDGIFNSYDVRGSFTIRAVRSPFPQPPLVDLPHRQVSSATTPGQFPGFDALLQEGQLVTFGHRQGGGLRGHLSGDGDAGVTVSAQATHLFSTRLSGHPLRMHHGEGVVVEERATLQMVSASDRFRFGLDATDWVTGEVELFASLPEAAALPDGTTPVTVTVSEPGQAAQVSVSLAEGEELPLEISWALDRAGVDCSYLPPEGDGRRRLTPCGSPSETSGSSQPVLRAETAGVHHIFVYSQDTGTGEYTFARR